MTRTEKSKEGTVQGRGEAQWPSILVMVPSTCELAWLSAEKQLKVLLECVTVTQTDRADGRQLISELKATGRI